MDGDHTTQFAQHFLDESFVVRSGNRWEEAILWLSFFPAEGTMSLGVYDSAVSKYSHSFHSTRAQDVASFIATVEADYGVQVPEKFRALSEEYLELAPQSFGVFEELQEEPAVCEYCGTESDELEAFYFPALKEGGEDSLAFKNRYGCYGDTTILGTTAEVGEQVLEAIGTALSSASAEKSVAKVREFEAKLRALLAA